MDSKNWHRSSLRYLMDWEDGSESGHEEENDPFERVRSLFLEDVYYYHDRCCNGGIVIYFGTRMIWCMHKNNPA